MDKLHKDGFIYDQTLWKSLKYGCRDSSQTGCGWIATYNLLHLLDYPYTPEQVCKTMSAWLPFGGLIGTHILPLYVWIRKHTPLHLSFVRKYSPLRLKNSKGGIVWYFTGKGLHFCAFSATSKKGIFHFYNAIYGKQDLTCTLPQFRKQFSAFPWIFILSVPNPTKKERR